MAELLTWLSAYSLPVVLLLILGAAALLIARQVIETAIKAQFDRYGKELSLRLERRSRFEEKIALDQYLAATKLFAEMHNISTELNRVRKGQKVANLYSGNELVPLTKVFVEMEAQRFLLGPTLFPILQSFALALLAWANALNDPEKLAEVGRAADSFQDAAGRIFGIDRVHRSFDE